MPKKSLRNLYDLLETKLRALEILGVTRDKYAAMLYPLVESALPEETLLAWERYRSTNRRSQDEENQNSKTTTKTDLDSILEFLQDEVQAEEQMILEEAQMGNSKYPAGVAEKLKNSFYVDNCLTSLQTETELHEFIQVAKDVMLERKFDLRGWEHNYSHSSTEEVSCVTNKIVPVLGLQWSLNSDTLSVNLKEDCEDNDLLLKGKYYQKSIKFSTLSGILVLIPEIVVSKTVANENELGFRISNRNL
ncbi:hypothetical protein HNY73_003362 [Argiope bruennichi]|uniref:Uncharacterized protein n=1 Tax=Argiope bruennichi TaxID=94029 RepID=A0A8T0FKB1_ARGBR|nr:hypothetical protein HNY73_003362 [Argiope bruennichi]